MGRFAASAAAIVWLSLVGCPARAQTGLGRLIGTAADTQHGVLPGVEVVVASPALIGRQSAVTNPDGTYLFPALPSGVYSLTFALANFQTLVREGVVLSLGTTTTIDVELEIAQVRDSVVVAGASPVIDVATTKVGVSLKGDALVGVPNSTDIWGVLAESPGIRMQGFDVGGSHKSSQSGYECSVSRIRAASFPMASITRRESGGPAITRTTTPARKSQSARWAATSK